jgi:hypothetical protein
VFVHSKLRRAKLTAHLVCGQKNFVELEDLNEANKIEHVITSLIYERVRNFEKWLGTQENNSVVVVVGHAQYFKYMLARADHMHNCDIWKLRPVISNKDNGAVTVNWGVSELTFRSQFSYTHPITRLKSVLLGQGDITDDANFGDHRAETTSADEEPTCRICQVDARSDWKLSMF